MSSADERDFGFGDALRFTRATESHLTYWLRFGIVGADVAAAGGPGRHRRLSRVNRYEIDCAAIIANATSLEGRSRPEALRGLSIALILHELRDSWPIDRDKDRRHEREMLVITFDDPRLTRQLDHLNLRTSEMHRHVAHPTDRVTAATYISKRDDAASAVTMIDLGVIADGVDERIGSLG